jgi:predicted DNA-binding transcriptional regulator AlpA
MRQDMATSNIRAHFEGERLITTREAASLMSMAPGTLARARVYGTAGYPPFCRIGGKAIRYKMSSIMAWLTNQNEYQHTSQ